MIQLRSTSMYLLIVGIFFLYSIGKSQPAETLLPLQNPINTSYLKKHLRKRQPRLILNAKTDKALKKALQTDPVVQNVYAAIKLNAETIFAKPLLQRKKTGKRLLAVSREMLYRMNMLCMVYHIEKDKAYLARINDELVAVCGFTDWNPSHFLDVAEMSLAVALALDWTAGDLPQSTIKLAIQALTDKGIKASYPPNGTPGWVTRDNNWNQVCNGGMIAASLAIAETNPDLAAKTIHRSLNGIPHALAAYGPDGVYPEGSTYWSYGTGFTVITAAMLESALGTDFGIASYPAFMESATFKVLSIAPSGKYFNYADCGDQRDDNGDFTLAWFASRTGNKYFFERDRFLMDPKKMGKLSRNAGAALVWLATYQEKITPPLPTVWIGDGSNPIAIFKSEDHDPHHYYLGAKGGDGEVNHGNMDAGSFVFELDGVRWVTDPGNQSYYDLEKTGFDLWSKCQDCARWTLLTKNNFGHSTLTVNNALHRVDGKSTIEHTQKSPPQVGFDLSPSLRGQLAQAHRTFTKDSPTSLLIEDKITTNQQTKMIVWQLITTTDVTLTKDGVILASGDKKLKVTNLSHPDISASVISLDPPPLLLDRRIDNLKRIEFRFPAYIFDGKSEKIKMRLSGNYD